MRDTVSLSPVWPPPLVISDLCRRVCHCPAGFTGEYCERELNECAKMHCGMGHCVDRIGEAQWVISSFSTSFLQLQPGFHFGSLSAVKCSQWTIVCIPFPCQLLMISTTSFGLSFRSVFEEKMRDREIVTILIPFQMLVPFRLQWRLLRDRRRPVR